MRLVAVPLNDNTAPDMALPPSVIRILSGALDVIASRGVNKLSMSDIIEASGVSRGTLYRYFSNKEEVLSAVSEYVCVGFEEGVAWAGSNEDDPIERLRAVMQFYALYTAENSPDRIFEVEPAFHLAFFRSRFNRYKQAMLNALEASFDYLDELMGETINRSAFIETLVRIQLSTLLVPASEELKNLWDDTPESLQKWAMRIAATHPESGKGI